MAYEMVMPYHLHMPSYFLETFTEYPYQVLQGIFRRKSYGFLETQRIIVGADTQLRPYKEYFKSVLINLFRLQKRDY